MKKNIRIIGIILLITGFFIWGFGAVICSDNHSDPAGIAFGVIGIAIGILGLVSIITSIFINSDDSDNN